MEKVIRELRIIETDDGYRIEIKGDKERMKRFMRGFRGRHGRRHRHGPFKFFGMPGPGFGFGGGPGFGAEAARLEGLVGKSRAKQLLPDPRPETSGTCGRPGTHWRPRRPSWWCRSRLWCSTCCSTDCTYPSPGIRMNYSGRRSASPYGVTCTTG